jgi:Helix-turn-helix domain/Domain of unknown function (DUF4115)
MLEIGSSLREARLKQGLTLADVEAATEIRGRYVQALEDERFEVLPAGAYRRSFLRTYATFLGLDPKVYAAEYELRLAPPEPEPRPPPRRRSSGAAIRPLSRALAILGAIVLVGVVVWRLGTTGSTSPPAPPARVAQPPRPRAPATTTTPSRHPLTPPKPPASLALTAARGPCWLQVRIGSSAGATVYEHTLQQGQTVRFGLRKPLWIRLGAPGNLDAAIGGRKLGPSFPTSTADVVVTATGLRASG